MSKRLVLDVEDLHDEVETVILGYLEDISSDEFLN
jgi:hypothetical protein